MLPFINYFSHEVGASWCREPKEADIPSKERSGGPKARQAWDGFSSEQRINKDDECGKCTLQISITQGSQFMKLTKNNPNL